MVRIETPQQGCLPHAHHPRREVGAPHAARAIRVLAAHDWVAQAPFRGLIVHRHFWAPHKDGEPVPVVVQTAQDLVFGKVERGLLERCLAAGVHLAQFRLQVAVALDKGQRLLVERSCVVPHLKAGRIEPGEVTEVFDPDKHPVLELRPAARRRETIAPHLRPALGQ
jgi:hypothetical protein